jgi:membrane protease YdiL (CAAX protease family)
MIPFFAIALGFTWALQLPAVLDARFMGVAMLGAFGPLVAAVILSRRERVPLFARFGIWRVPAWTYAFSLVGFGAIYVLGRAVWGVTASDVTAPWWFPPENAQHIAGLVVMPFVEEVGWRGYALPRLLARTTPIRATLILGAVWSVWHVMMFLMVGVTSVAFVVALVNVFVGNFVFTWLYQRSKGSLLIAWLAHVGVHVCNPSHAMPDWTPLAVYTGALAVVSVALVALDRRAFTDAALTHLGAHAGVTPAPEPAAR